MRYTCFQQRISEVGDATKLIWCWINNELTTGIHAKFHNVIWEPPTDFQNCTDNAMRLSGEEEFQLTLAKLRQKADQMQ